MNPFATATAELKPMLVINHCIPTCQRLCVNGIRTLGAHLHVPEHEVAADLRQPDASDC